MSKTDAGCWPVSETPRRRLRRAAGVSPSKGVGEATRSARSLGLLIIQAITFSDIPVIAAYLMLIALLFVTINAVVDLLYFWVDPRVRLA